MTTKIRVKVKHKPTLYQIESGSESYFGFCVNCGCDSVEQCEPDARFRKCPECGEHAAFGLEELLSRGIVDIDEETDF